MTVYSYPQQGALTITPAPGSDFATETTLSERLSGSLVPTKFDYVSYTPGATDDTYVYKTGGSGGTTVRTVVITYTDATKSVISNATAT